MQDSFDIFKFTYVKKDEGMQVKLAKIIWARTEETAQKIIDIDPDEWFLLKKEATKTNRPPLELEQEQLEVARYNRMKRQELTKRIVSETLKKLGKKEEQPKTELQDNRQSCELKLNQFKQAKENLEKIKSIPYDR